MDTREQLGPLEMQVLGLLQPGERLSVGDVRSRLKASRVDLAYTTVMTVLGRLHAKGVVQRVKEGNRYLYTPARHAAQVSAGILSRVQRKLFGSDRAGPILALLQDEKLSADELKTLRRAIDDQLRKKS